MLGLKQCIIKSQTSFTDKLNTFRLKCVDMKTTPQQLIPYQNWFSLGFIVWTGERALSANVIY